MKNVIRFFLNSDIIFIIFTICFSRKTIQTIKEDIKHEVALPVCYTSFFGYVGVEYLIHIRKHETKLQSENSVVI